MPLFEITYRENVSVRGRAVVDAESAEDVRRGEYTWEQDLGDDERLDSLGIQEIESVQPYSG